MGDAAALNFLVINNDYASKKNFIRCRPTLTAAGFLLNVEYNTNVNSNYKQEPQTLNKKSFLEKVI